GGKGVGRVLWLRRALGRWGLGSTPRAPRTLDLTGEATRGDFPQNATCNQKFNPITFLPIVLYEQFKFFFNLYFLLVALSQFIPYLQVGKRWDFFRRWDPD